MNDRLPYEFDLLWDIKTKEQLYSILKGGMHCTETCNWELEEVMKKYSIPLPDGYESETSDGFPTKIWIDKNGSYLTHKPTESESGNYKIMVRPQRCLI